MHTRGPTETRSPEGGSRMLIAILLLCLTAVRAIGQPSPDPTGAGMIRQITDRPNDAGDALILDVEPGCPEENVLLYLLERRASDEVSWVEVAMIPVGELRYIDGLDPDYPIVPGERYEYRLLTATVSGDTLSALFSGDVPIPAGEWFNTGTVPVMVACAVFLFLIFRYFGVAQSGRDLYLRPIAGIEAIDEAIGRATEMGKPILYVPGLSTIDDVATVASLTILSRVARKVAEYQTTLVVPNADPIVYTVAEESVKQAYIEAGRPDSYDQDSVFFITQTQFAYVAAVNGIMVRDRPATNFYLGMFWAESLILAETGSLSGAIQIAGTDAVTQLPFFITTCDYTLIGEELYAASAYLGREPKQLAAVKGQDACKAIIMFLVISAALLGIVDLVFGSSLLDHVRDAIAVDLLE